MASYRMEASQLATLAIVSLLGLEKAVMAMQCNLSDSIKAMHLNCSDCCAFDVEARTPPNSPTTPQLSNPLVVEPPSRI